MSQPRRDTTRRGIAVARTALAALAALAVLGAATPVPPAPAAGEPAVAATGTVIGPSFYPRLVRLQHAGSQDGTILATYQLGQEGRILRSVDDGATFEEIAAIDVGAETEIPAPGGCAAWSSGRCPPRSVRSPPVRCCGRARSP